MKRLSIFLAILLIISCFVPTVLAEENASTIWTLNTDGAPICCGSVAQIFRNDLITSGSDVYPVLHNSNGELLPPDQLASTGDVLTYTVAGEEITRTFVLLGDVIGTGRFNIAQLVRMANLLTADTNVPTEVAASDLTGDGEINIADLVILAGYVRDAKEPMPQEPYPEPDTQSRSLVVYYSATGTTRRIAEMMAEHLNADLFELVPTNPYTAADLNYNNPDSRVSREHDDPALRDVPLVQDTVDNFASYDNIYIGYPIWWGIAAWPVNSFIAANNFEGKNVWCFCTAVSSGLGQSADLLAEIADGGNWLGGHRFSSGSSQEDVSAWLDSLSKE